MSTTFLILKDRLKKLIGDDDGGYGKYYQDAINGAARESYSSLFRYLRNTTLVTGNALPNASFESWVSSSYPDKYNKITATCAETTAAGLTWGAGSSCLISPSAADGYMFITSGNTSDAGYPRLLDLMGQTITFRCWVKPSTVNDAFIEIYTLKETSTGTIEQQLTSTATTDVTTGWILLELEDQAINDDITEIQFRFIVHTNGQTAYFDRASVTGFNSREYYLPIDFSYGTLCSVKYQTSGSADFIADDQHLKPNFDYIWGWGIITDGATNFLRLPRRITSNRALELIGYRPLEDTMSADTDTMSIDGEHVELLLMKAAAIMYRRLRGKVSSDSRDKYDDEFRFWESEYLRNENRLKMTKPSMQLKVRG